MTMRDPYDVLGVAKTASDSDIKSAYRKLAKRLHPDLNPGNKKIEERFKEVSVAYDLLSDPEKRRRFDKGEIDASGAERPHHSFYRTYAESPRGQKYQSARSAEGFSFQDIFEDMFRGAERQRGSTRMAGENLAYTLAVSFLDAARGATTRISIPGGKTLNVAIPAGVEDGETLRLKGQGAPGAGGAPSGDAYIEIRIEPHPYFRRDGMDIHLELPITLQEAVLGAKVEVPTVEGWVNLSIPRGSNTGDRLRLKDKGLADRKTKERGNQYVTLKVVLPETVDEDLGRAVESWAKKHPYDVRRKAGLAR